MHSSKVSVMVTACWITFVILSFFAVNTHANEHEMAPIDEKHLARSSVIYGLTMMTNYSNVHENCYTQLKQLQRSILQKQAWALRVLDASGTKPSGFIYGQNFWFGSRDACNKVRNSETMPFDMDYRVIYLHHNSPWQVEIKLMSEQIIHIGLCLPSVCESHEIQQLTTDFLKHGVFAESEIYDMRPQVMYMKDLKLNKSFYEKRSLKLLGAVISFTLLMTLCAWRLRMKSIAEAKAATAAESSQSLSNTTKVGHVQLIHRISADIKNFISCYDLTTNYEKMFFTTDKVCAANEIPVINGLRSIYAVQLTFFHVGFFMYFTVNNKSELLVFLNNNYAPVCVDGFFTISGFLQTYKFMRNAEQLKVIRQNSFSQNVKYFFKLLFHRYLRLAPLYLIVMGVFDILYAYIADVSIYYINERFAETCSQHWWRNIFFIQNFFDLDDMCVAWTWSLACEMQFFILVTILLFSYAKHPQLVKAVTFIALIATFTWSYLIGILLKFELTADGVAATVNEIYINSFVRIMPYIVGGIYGWYVVEQPDQFAVSDTKQKWFWNLSSLGLVNCIGLPLEKRTSYVLDTSTFVIGRLLFSVSVCWMIIGSATGRSCWWSRLLEGKVFQYFNRLTYAIYLLNPIVIVTCFSLTNSSTHVDFSILFILLPGFMVIIYLTSIVFSLLFEMPYCNWSSMLRKHKKKSA